MRCEGGASTTVRRFARMEREWSEEVKCMKSSSK